MSASLESLQTRFIKDAFVVFEALSIHTGSHGHPTSCAGEVGSSHRVSRGGDQPGFHCVDEAGFENEESGFATPVSCPTPQCYDSGERCRLDLAGSIG